MSRTRRSVVVGADPEGSVLSGDTARPYLTEGVGEDFFPGTYDPAIVDRWVRVSDRDAFAAARRLTREEGILAGGSCGTALVAALDGRARALAERRARARGKVIVVLLPDSGRSYLSKVYNDEWMRVNGLLATTGGGRPGSPSCWPAATGDDGRPAVVVARTTERVGEAIETAPGVRDRQMPVSEDAEGDAVAGIVGSISEKGLLERAYRDPSVVERTVGEVMDAPAAARGRVGDARRGVRAAERRRAGRSSRSAASGRPASSRSSTCSSTCRTAAAAELGGAPQATSSGRQLDRVRLEQREVDRAAFLPRREHRVDAGPAGDSLES